MNCQFQTQIFTRLASLAGYYLARAEAPEPMLPCPMMCLVGIGVHQSERMRKIGTSLLKAFEAKARCARARLMVALNFATLATNHRGSKLSV